MADITNLPTQTQNIEEALTSIGLNVGAQDGVADDQLRVASVDFLNQLNQLFGDKTQITTYDPAQIQKIKDGMQKALLTPDEKGDTGLQKLKAIAEGDIGFLIKDMDDWKQPFASGKLQNIYHNSKFTAEHKALKVLEMGAKGDAATAELLRDLKTHAPGILANIPGATKLLEQSDALFADLKALDDAQFYDQKIDDDALAQMNRGEQLTSAKKLVEAQIGASPDGEWGEAEQIKLKAYLKDLVSNEEFAEGWEGDKEGVYTLAFGEFMESRFAMMPAATTVQEVQKIQMQEFAAALSLMEENDVALRSFKDDLTLTKASAHVEQTLAVLVPILNEKLKQAEKDSTSKFDEFEEKLGLEIPEEIKGFLVEIKSQGLFDQTIPEIQNADGRFDIRAEGSLQGLLTVLGNPNMIGFEGQHDWLYSPAAGKHIMTKMPDLRAQLKEMMSEEEFAKVEGMLSDENVANFVDALDHLHKYGRIGNELLITPDGHTMTMPVYTQNIFQDKIYELDAENPDLLVVMDLMTREYAGRKNGIHELMPDLKMRDLNVDAGLPREDALQQYYEAALKTHKENGGTNESFAAELFAITNTVAILPFGSDDYRHDFWKTVQDEISKAANDPAGFGSGVVVSVDKLFDEHGVPAYKSYLMRDKPVWHPDLKEKAAEIIVGGQPLDVKALTKAYDDFQLAHADEDYRKQAAPNIIDSQSYIKFKDDDGNYYVAAIDKTSRVFSVEKVDIERIKQIREEFAEGLTPLDPRTQEHEILARDEKLMDELRAEDPGLALIFPKGGPNMEVSVPDFIHFMESPVTRHFNDFQKDYASRADGIRGDFEARQELEKTKDPAPFITDSEYDDGTEMPTRDFTKAAQPGTRGPINVKQRSLEQNALVSHAAQVSVSPSIMHPGNSADERNFDVLKKYEREGTSLGTYKGASITVKNVSVASGADNLPAPMMSWYDKNAQSVKVEPLPAYLTDGAQRADIKSLIGDYKTQPDSEATYLAVREQYPEFFKHVQNFRHDGQAHPLILQSPIPRAELAGFKQAASMVIRSLEEGLSATPKINSETRPPRQTFMEQARGGIERISEVGKIFGQAVTEVPKAYWQSWSTDGVEMGKEVVRQKIERIEGVINNAGNIMDASKAVASEGYERTANEIKAAPAEFGRQGREYWDREILGKEDWQQPKGVDPQ